MTDGMHGDQMTFWIVTSGEIVWSDFAIRKTKRIYNLFWQRILFFC